MTRRKQIPNPPLPVNPTKRPRMQEGSSQESAEPTPMDTSDLFPLSSQEFHLNNNGVSIHSVFGVNQSAFQMHTSFCLNPRINYSYPMDTCPHCNKALTMTTDGDRRSLSDDDRRQISDATIRSPIEDVTEPIELSEDQQHVEDSSAKSSGEHVPDTKSVVSLNSEEQVSPWHVRTFPNPLIDDSMDEECDEAFLESDPAVYPNSLSGDSEAFTVNNADPFSSQREQSKAELLQSMFLKNYQSSSQMMSTNNEVQGQGLSFNIVNKYPFPMQSVSQFMKYGRNNNENSQELLPTNALNVTCKVQKWLHNEGQDNTNPDELGGHDSTSNVRVDLSIGGTSNGFAPKISSSTTFTKTLGCSPDQLNRIPYQKTKFSLLPGSETIESVPDSQTAEMTKEETRMNLDGSQGYAALNNFNVGNQFNTSDNCREGTHQANNGMKSWSVTIPFSNELKNSNEVIPLPAKAFNENALLAPMESFSERSSFPKLKSNEDPQIETTTNSMSLQTKSAKCSDEEGRKSPINVFPNLSRFDNMMNFNNVAQRPFDKSSNQQTLQNFTPNFGNVCNKKSGNSVTVNPLMSLNGLGFNVGYPQTHNTGQVYHCMDPSLPETLNKVKSYLSEELTDKCRLLNTKVPGISQSASSTANAYPFDACYMVPTTTSTTFTPPWPMNSQAPSTSQNHLHHLIANVPKNKAGSNIRRYSPRGINAKPRHTTDPSDTESDDGSMGTSD